MATERDVPVRLWRCPECKAEAFWPAEPWLPGGPALCGHPSSGYVSALYVPAVLSEELVEKVALVRFAEAYDSRAPEGTAESSWRAVDQHIRDVYLGLAEAALRAAGFVSEPSTGGDDAC